MLRTLAISIAAILFAASAWSQDPSPSGREAAQPQQSQPGASDQPARTNQQTTPQPPIVVNVVPAQKTEAEAAEDRRERHEKAEFDRRLVELTGELAWFTAGLFVATVALVIATIGLGYFGFRQVRDMKASIAVAQTAATAAQKSATVAKKTLILTQRPWVAIIDVIPASPLRFGPAGAIISLTFQLKNVGPSPACNVRVRAEIHGLRGSTVHQNRVCQEAKEIRLAGFTLFPGMAIDHQDSLLIGRDEIEKETYPGDLGSRWFDPIVYGCVTYEFSSFEEGYHQTGFVLRLTGLGLKNIDVIDEGETPIRIVSMPFGPTAD